jgi:hypothetical protein
MHYSEDLEVYSKYTAEYSMAGTFEKNHSVIIAPQILQYSL